jgi:hypothetical protein
MTNRNIKFDRAFVEQMQQGHKARAALARVRRGVNVRRRDAGVLRTLARGSR